MKWKHKLLVSFSALSLLTMGGSAWAAGQFRTIEVYFDRVHIEINGQQAELSKDSIIYDGSVYVPLRSMSEMLGAEVGWDNATGTVHLDFIQNDQNPLFNASQKGLYQYIAIRNNQIAKDLIPILKKNDFAGMKSVISRYDELSSLATNIGDKPMAQTIEKMKTALVLLQTGFESKTMDDYMLAWTIYSTNADQLNKDLKTKLSDSFQFQIKAVTP